MRPPISDIEKYRAQVEALKAEAKGYGVFITSTVLADVKRTVDQIRRARKGKPPCYWRSYDKAARECMICEARGDCARGDVTPQDGQALSIVSCERCDGGNLSVALIDPASGDVRDYGCSTADCTNTLAIQCGHAHSSEESSPKRIEVRRATERVIPGRTLEEVEQEVIDYIKENDGCSVTDVCKGITASASRAKKALDGLRARGAVHGERIGRAIRLFVEA